MVVFDSNIWVGLLNIDDSCHRKAKTLFRKIKEKVILPEYVILEVATIVSQKVGKKAIDGFLENIINNQDVRILPSSKEFLEEIINFYLSKKNKRLSFVDYSLLYLSQKLKVLTFDRNLQKEIKKI